MWSVAFRPAIWVAGLTIGIALAGCGVVDERNDPEPYRSQIEKIEDLLQKPQAERGDGKLLSQYVSELAAKMGKNIQHIQARETVMNLLINFGESWANEESLTVQYAEAGDDIVPFEMADVRQSWKELREMLFEPASWFQ